MVLVKSARLKTLIFLLLFVVAPMCAVAQMDIDNITINEMNALRFADSIRVQRIASVDFYSEARQKYERRKIRHERNKLEVTTALQGGLTNLSKSWMETSGGDNTVSMLATLNARHTYTKDRFSVLTHLITKFGYYRLSLEEKVDGETINVPTWYKNQDELQLSITPSLKMSDHWSYAASIKFRSQFANGYASASAQEEYNMKSTFMSPGYLDVSAGFIYKSPNEKLPFVINISPLAMSATYVTSQTVRDNSQYKYLEHKDSNYKYSDPYGVYYQNTSKYEGGSSIQIDFKRSFGKDDFLTYDTSLYSFYGWMTQLTYENVLSSYSEYEAALEDYDAATDGVPPILSIRPVARWENEIRIKATKLLSTTLSCQLYYNKAQNLRLQTKTYLVVGLSYTFKNNLR